MYSGAEKVQKKHPFIKKDDKVIILAGKEKGKTVLLEKDGGRGSPDLRGNPRLRPEEGWLP